VAVIAGGAHVFIVARGLVQLVLASYGRVAAIGRTQVVVVAIDTAVEDAGPTLAVVTRGALVSVVALSLVGRVHAPHILVTRVIGARIGIAALQGRSAHAESPTALVIGRADVSVAAGCFVVLEDAARFGIARVVGAWISVVAEGRRTGLALAADALVANGAPVSVVASEALVVRFQRALSGRRLAHDFLADDVVRNQAGAVHYGIWLNGADVGQLVHVAEQEAVAQVPVFEGLAVLVFDALAIHRIPGTLAFAALVRYRAGVGIVAVGLVVLSRAAAESVADVVRAGIAVVARDGQTQADSVLAMVADRAHVSVDALALVEVLVQAPILPDASVFGAVIVVVADVLVFSPDQRRIVDLAVAVVVHAVATLLLRNSRIAVRQPLFGAYSLSLADSPFA